MKLVSNFGTFLASELEELDCTDITRAYVVSVFDRFRFASTDFSQDSVTLMYASAQRLQAFQKFQDIGDWLFFTHSLYQPHLNSANIEYYITLGQMSYYSCYRLLNRQWRVYEEIADKFPDLTVQARDLLIG